MDNKELSAVESEMVYYLAFAAFERYMKQQGFEMNMPEASDDKLSADDLYDLAAHGVVRHASFPPSYTDHGYCSRAAAPLTISVSSVVIFA